MTDLNTLIPYAHCNLHTLLANVSLRTPGHSPLAAFGRLLTLVVACSLSVGCKTAVTEIPTRWISITAKASQHGSGTARGLTGGDFDQLKATVPTIVQAVPERNSAMTATYQGKTEEAKVCATSATDMRHLLTDAKTEILTGSYFDEPDPENEVVVISASFADSLFGTTNPIDETIQLGSREFTVIGVLSPPDASAIRLQHQIYMDITSQQKPGQQPPGELDRIWIKVRSLTDLTATTEIIHEVLTRNHGETEFEVRSTHFEPTDL